jgi:hypothetical protein
MADPTDVACADGVWTEVATNITTGQIEVIKDNPTYLVTVRESPAVHPTLESEGTVLREWIKVRHSAGVDVFVWANGSGASVRVYA